MIKIFITGATGYVGGDALHNLVERHPDYEITALVRSKEKGELVSSCYPSVHLVYGDLDDFELLATEASKADITCNWANCEHLNAAEAIADGLSRKRIDTPGFFIHLSGADLLCFPDVATGTYGKRNERIFNDTDGLDEVISPMNNAPHQEVDLAILGAAKDGGKTAIVCPPTIYGPGRGPGNKRSIQIPELALYSLQRGTAFTVQGGENIWSAVHIHDLTNLFLKLIESAAQGGGRADWGLRGFYFAESSEFSWKSIAERIAKEGSEQGYLKSSKINHLSAAEADTVWPSATFFWGTNSRSKAIRARAVLDWEPMRNDIFEDVLKVTVAEIATLDKEK